MRRKLVAALVVSFAAAGCGGGHQQSKQVGVSSSPSGQRSYSIKLPNGHVVNQAHSPLYARPPKGFPQPPKASITGAVDQYDSVTLTTVPKWAHYVAGYVDGSWPTYWSMRGRWPVVVGISVRTADGADCFDMEPGNPGPWNAGPWAKWQFSQGSDRPCEYSMLSWMPSIRSNLSANGVAVCYSATQRHCVRLWDANWTYVRHIDAGYAGTQWSDHALNSNLDISAMHSWFYTQPHPPKPPTNPYAIFPTGPFPSRYGPLNERLTVQQFDGAWAHRARYRGYLRHVLSHKLDFLAHRAAYVALTLHHGWGRDHLGVRFQVLIHDSQKASRA